MKRITRSDSKIQYIPYEKGYGKKISNFEDIECRIPDISKLRKLIHFQLQYETEDIVRDTADYFLEQKRKGR